MARRENKAFLKDLQQELEAVEGNSRSRERNEALTVLRAREMSKAFRHLGEELPLASREFCTGARCTAQIPAPRRQAPHAGGPSA